ncbi:hypothetical protein [Salipiger sp. PrR002]|uniref:hypothetical protein n=1 Tax=Salipiger sp. PrR002 TaxID=2706489 RepID=UPI0013BABC77|nr:hypothetical protein [Salipiger sp. PrR002]NDW00238.1 hypothetical protein [Salipiger sp. PrR002]NDW58623.1 hypothetical protein [Salipiger sp. PrR004]
MKEYIHDLDRRDVALWLKSKHPAEAHHLVVCRTYTAAPEVLAHVLVRARDQSAEARIRGEAILALEAMGYRIEYSGGDVYDVSLASLHGMSDHDMAQCVERVSAALRGGDVGALQVGRNCPMGPSCIDDDF